MPSLAEPDVELRRRRWPWWRPTWWPRRKLWWKGLPAAGAWRWGRRWIWWRWPRRQWWIRWRRWWRRLVITRVVVLPKVFHWNRTNLLHSLTHSLTHHWTVFPFTAPGYGGGGGGGYSGGGGYGGGGYGGGSNFGGAW